MSLVSEIALKIKQKKRLVRFTVVENSLAKKTARSPYHITHVGMKSLGEGGIQVENIQGVDEQVLMFMWLLF